MRTPDTRTMQSTVAALLVVLSAGVVFAGEARRSSTVPMLEAGGGTRAQAFPGLVRRDDAHRTITIEPAPGGVAATAAAHGGRYGKLVVRNHTGVTVDVYVAFDDGVSSFDFLDTLPSGYRLRARITKRTSYLVAGEVADDYDGFWSWGPTSFFLRRKFTYTMLP